MRDSPEISVVTPEPRAAADLFERHGPMIYRRARLLMGAVPPAMEVVRQVFILLAALGTPMEPGREVPVLVRLTTSCCLQRMRVERHGAHDEGDRLAPLRPLLASGNESEAEAALLVHVDGMSIAEAADLVGVSPASMLQRVEQFELWVEAEAGAEPASEES